MSLAVLLSGQGGQHPAMVDLVADHPAAQEIFAAATPLLGADPRDLARTGGPALHTNRTGQILCCVAGLAAWTVLRDGSHGRVVLAGYSIGDLAAWGCAGRLSPASVLHLAAARAEAMDEASGPGYGLAGLRGLSRARVAALVEEHGCHLAILNAADSVVAGGAVADLETLCARALASGAARAVLLPVHTPSHTPLLAAASARFRAELARAEILPPSRLGPPPPRLLSGLDGAPVFDAAKGLDKLAEAISRTIDWAACLDGIREAGARAVLELGPGHALATMARDAMPGAAVHTVSDFRSLSGLTDWLAAQEGAG
ncbi:acyltransferase domain-containing protein [Methylobacterium sp. Leaf106]|uniref:acyltransferase domain-containing protein n=1 Tax=Methylobacterium sp. Leaf106 TaxID=1736255 RepID=UPI0006FA8C37|nr:acyltransferase domain-containing protein [Methylobacterium sp. Leaf106]KQP39492.1 acyl transferase [Methylobacterium sp. Leaf106]